MYGFNIPNISISGIVQKPVQGKAGICFNKINQIPGIPDYRSEEVGLYARSNHKPIQYQEFVKYPKVRQRYWARNFIGWPRFSSIEPNATHHAITVLQKVNKGEEYKKNLP